MATNAALFAHRRNEDGSCGSICRTCFAVIACSTREEDLARYEKAMSAILLFSRDSNSFTAASSLEVFANRRTQRL